MDHEQWQKWWTDRAPEYFTDKIWRFSHPDLIDRLNIQPHHCVLELGFGYGRELSQFCALSTNVYGLELTDWSCENTLIELQGRGVRPLPRLKSYDGLRLPFPSGAFNVVYSCFVIQHLSRKHALGLIRETLRVLSHDGLALFEFFGDPEYHDPAGDVFSGVDGQGGMFNNAWTPDEIRGLINNPLQFAHLYWLETKSVTQGWGNHWTCFGRSNGQG